MARNSNVIKEDAKASSTIIQVTNDESAKKMIEKVNPVKSLDDYTPEELEQKAKELKQKKINDSPFQPLTEDIPMHILLKSAIKPREKSMRDIISAEIQRQNKKVLGTRSNPIVYKA